MLFHRSLRPNPKPGAGSCVSAIFRRLDHFTGDTMEYGFLFQIFSEIVVNFNLNAQFMEEFFASH